MLFVALHRSVVTGYYDPVAAIQASKAACKAENLATGAADKEPPEQPIQNTWHRF